MKKFFQGSSFWLCNTNKSMWADPTTQKKPPTILVIHLSPDNIGTTVSSKALEGKFKGETLGFYQEQL